MRVFFSFLGFAALAGLPGPASAHPGADAHLHATHTDRCEPHTRTRRLGALIDEARLLEARTELEAGRDCPQTLPGLVVAEADLLRLEGQPALALPLLDRILANEPTHAGARSSRARAHAALGQPDRAADDWLALARAHAQALEPWFQAARVAPDRAADILEEALTHHGQVPTVRMAAAEALLPSNPTRGLAVLEAHPDTVDAWLLRARLHEAQGDAAARDLDRMRAREAALAMRPSPKRAELLARIDATAPFQSPGTAP